MVDAPVEHPIQRTDPFGEHRILVLIASYRDPELPHTIKSALVNAAYPEHVRFAICHQHDDDTAPLLDPWRDDPRFAIDEVPYEESKGVCWARNRCFDRYDGEAYVLQIDAHTQFAARWDVRYVSMLRGLDPETKPILTTYPPSYKLLDDGTREFDLLSGLQRLMIKWVKRDLNIRQKTTPWKGEQPVLPLVAAGQIFAHGEFCEQVPYDPNYYFEGEEIALAAHAYTRGFTAYCPSENLIWHRYSHGESLHWEDHGDHDARHRGSMDRVSTLLRGDHASLGEFSLGEVRSRDAFGDEIDVDFEAARRRTGRFSVVGTIDLADLPIDRRDDYASWVFAIFDNEDVELWREDIVDPGKLSHEVSEHAFEAEQLEGEPDWFLVWPSTEAGEFLERIERPIPDSFIVPPTDPALDAPEPQDTAPADAAATRDERLAESRADGSVVALHLETGHIEPRDDYRSFEVVFFDASGSESGRHSTTDPSILDLSRNELVVDAAAIENAVQMIVVPTRPRGADGELRLQPVRRVS